MLRWLIAYDIADTARLQRAYRILCNHALPLQNSVFLLVGSAEDYRQCLDELLPKLHSKQMICVFIRCLAAVFPVLWAKKVCRKGFIWLCRNKALPFLPFLYKFVPDEIKNGIWNNLFTG